MRTGETWDDQGRRARAALAGGALSLLCGLAMVGIGASDVGMAVTLAALLATIYGIHTFGRLGPAEADPALAPPARRKKKKRPPRAEAARDAGPTGDAG